MRRCVKPIIRQEKRAAYAAIFGGAISLNVAASVRFGSVISWSFSSVMPGTISSTNRPSGVTSITARLV